MVPSAVRWARAVGAAVWVIPRVQLPRPSRTSLLTVTWVLAAAADFDDRIPPDHTAAVLTREVGVGDRVWQKYTACYASVGGCSTAPADRTMDGSLAARGDALGSSSVLRRSWPGTPGPWNPWRP